jgi:hypothetical protein
MNDATPQFNGNDATPDYARDWTGNKKSTFSTLGASNHSNYKRAEKDFYATDPIAIELLYKNFWEQIGFSNNIWECACGNGHLSKRLNIIAPHITIKNSDIIKRDFDCEEINFLKTQVWQIDENGDAVYYWGDIITNPPYKYALEFVERGLEIVAKGYKVAMFLKITFLEGQKRRKFFDKFPPKYVLVFSKRIQVARNGEKEMFDKSSAACYAWFVWEKGYSGDPIIKWI